MKFQYDDFCKVFNIDNAQMLLRLEDDDKGNLCMSISVYVNGVYMSINIASADIDDIDTIIKKFKDSDEDFMRSAKKYIENILLIGE